MADSNVLDRMRHEWNERAREDPNYYVAFGRREQDDAEFFATAADVVRGLRGELKRFQGRGAASHSGLKALEIGCGPGRLLRPMSADFAEIHGMDVSDEMIRLASEKLREVPNAHVHHTEGPTFRSSRTSLSISFTPTRCFSTSPAGTWCWDTWPKRGVF